jgi:hypothetical protein|tara:strand:+ start:4826 stop:5017 length:192 start_codon:yes stop_codon:yes gene_type:complete
MDYEQLTQDVLDGKESPKIGRETLMNELKRISKCLKEVDDVYFNDLKDKVNNDKFYFLNTKEK